MQNPQEKLESLYKKACSVKEVTLSHEVKESVNIISENCFNQKGVYTVFITLAVYKILHPEQDIRYHQSNMEGGSGFSGRSVDTKHITPTLKKLRLPAMKESGWLTRSLEQPFPYTLDYQGKISNKTVKGAFLFLVDYIEKSLEKL